MALILQCSAQSHSAKDLYLHKIWTKLIIDEQLKQGQFEKKYSLPLNKLADEKLSIAAVNY